MGLCVSGSYRRALNLTAFALVPLLAYGVGLRDAALVWTVLCGIVPVQWLIGFITIRLFPPELELSGDFRGILFPAPQGDRISEFDASPDSEVETDDRRMFHLTKHHRSLEGLVLAAAALVLGLAWAWMAAEPLLVRLFPGWGATKTGPPEFPVTVRLGNDHVSVTNGSATHWTCHASLGISPAYLSSFSLEPKQTRALSYFGFRGTEATVDPANVDIHSAVVLRAGRQRIALACSEPSGITHFRQF